MFEHKYKLVDDESREKWLADLEVLKEELAKSAPEALAEQRRRNAENYSLSLTRGLN
jgi:hypothetical protein